MDGSWRGVIEGFYGPPWSWDERIAVMAWCHERGMTHYVYAPKDDPLHRDRWRDPYPDAELDGFARLVDAGTLRVAFAVSPGLSIDPSSATDRASLAAKIDQVLATGVHDVVLALDDIPATPDQGARHGELTAWLADHLTGRAELALVPTDYTSCRPTPYLTDLAAACPVEVPIAWTGPRVVCDEITVDDAERRAAALDGRPPMMWDNYPVNDLLMRDRLFFGPLRGRSPELLDATRGWVANPMIQARASLLPLASVAAFLRREDPSAVWGDEADRLGIRRLAEACDGVRPLELVEQLVDSITRSADARAAAIGSLRRWLDEVLSMTGSPPVEWLGDGIEPWVEQTRAEAEVCVRALDLIEMLAHTTDALRPSDGPTDATIRVLLGWQRVRRGQVSSFGPRCSLRPSLSQDDEVGWRFHRSSLLGDRNATDRLVTALLELVEH